MRPLQSVRQSVSQLFKQTRAASSIGVAQISLGQLELRLRLMKLRLMRPRLRLMRRKCDKTEGAFTY